MCYNTILLFYTFVTWYSPLFTILFISTYAHLLRYITEKKRVKEKIFRGMCTLMELRS